jgi:hypothetical protein
MSNESNDESIQQLRKRVEAEPFDLSLRFEFGVALHRAGDIRASIPELQRARQHPERRVAATRLLAEVFAALGMADVAARLRHSSDQDEPPDSDDGSAAKPAPLHPIAPLLGAAAKQLPTEPESDGKNA